MNDSYISSTFIYYSYLKKNMKVIQTLCSKYLWYQGKLIIALKISQAAIFSLTLRLLINGAIIDLMPSTFPIFTNVSSRPLGFHNQRNGAVVIHFCWSALFLPQTTRTLVWEAASCQTILTQVLSHTLSFIPPAPQTLHRSFIKTMKLPQPPPHHLPPNVIYF